MRDVDQKSDADTPYECFDCGNIVLAENSPVDCPNCSGAMRNRRTPLE